MEFFGRYVVYLTFNQICDINRKMIYSTRGSFSPPNNLFNRDGLEYIIQKIYDPEININDHYSLKEKAACLGYYIISRHIFFDGNKRTGIHAAWEFLKANGINLSLDSSIIELALSMAQNKANEHDFYNWLIEHQES